jgi:hypothetical protein
VVPSGLRRRQNRPDPRLLLVLQPAELPDFEQRLLKNFSMRPQGMEWLTAWEIPEPKQAMKDKRQLHPNGLN